MATKASGLKKFAAVSDDGEFDMVDHAGNAVVCVEGGKDEGKAGELVEVRVVRDFWTKNPNEGGEAIRHRGGAILSLPADIAMEGIESGAMTWHRAESSEVQSQKAKTRSGELVEYAFEKANRQGAFDRVSDFAEYTRWCAGKDINALPLDITAGRLFLIERAAAGAGMPRLEKMAKSLGFIQELCMEAPRGPTGRWLWEGYLRALGFAKHRLGTEGVPLVQRDAMAAEKALKLFPDGNIPSLLSDVA